MKTNTVLLICATCKREFHHPAAEFVRSTGTWPKDCPSCMDEKTTTVTDALKGLFENCQMIHTRWGEGDNSKEADAAIERARAAILKAEAE